MSSNEWFRPHTSTTQDLSMRAHRHFDKVTSFYLGPLAKPVELWLLFECCFACLVLLIGFMTSDATFKSCFLLPPLHVHDELSSRTTLFQVGGDDAARPTVFGSSCASTSRTTLKAEVTEAWKRRRKKMRPRSPRRRSRMKHHFRAGLSTPTKAGQSALPMHF